MLTSAFFRSPLTAAAWLLIMCLLFFLPGSAFPTRNWLSDIYFDKWVHFGLFAVLLFLWTGALKGLPARRWLLTLAICFIYGLGVEIAQEQFVANRSFDGGDLLADMAGAGAGLLFWLWVAKKNKPL
jgi:VanZ family protein